jgi:hypothetical protein
MFSYLEEKGKLKSILFYCHSSSSIPLTLNHMKETEEVVTTSLILIGECNVENFFFFKEENGKLPSGNSLPTGFLVFQHIPVAVDIILLSILLKIC